jgi:hypothetical protein
MKSEEEIQKRIDLLDAQCYELDVKAYIIKEALRWVLE